MSATKILLYLHSLCFSYNIYEWGIGLTFCIGGSLCRILGLRASAYLWIGPITLSWNWFSNYSQEWKDEASFTREHGLFIYPRATQEEKLWMKPGK